MSVEVIGIARDEVVAQTPGETAGPVIVVSLRITNSTSGAIDLGSTIVELRDVDGNSARPTTAGPFAPFTETVGPDESSEAVYVFGVPADLSPSVHLSVSYAGGAPVASFTGDVV